jgi:hypothetical protein
LDHFSSLFILMIYLNAWPTASRYFMPMTLFFISLQIVFPNHSQNSTPTYDPFPVILTTTSLHSIMTKQSSSFSPVDNA